MEKAPGKSQDKYILPNSWTAILKIVKVIKNKESLKNCLTYLGFLLQHLKGATAFLIHSPKVHIPSNKGMVRPSTAIPLSLVLSLSWLGF